MRYSTEVLSFRTLFIRVQLYTIVRKQINQHAMIVVLARLYCCMIRKYESTFVRKYESTTEVQYSICLVSYEGSWYVQLGSTFVLSKVRKYLYEGTKVLPYTCTFVLKYNTHKNKNVQPPGVRVHVLYSTCSCTSAFPQGYVYSCTCTRTRTQLYFYYGQIFQEVKRVQLQGYVVHVL